MEIRRLDQGPYEVSPVATGEMLVPDGREQVYWQVAEEMPVAILLNGQTFAVMMMTPADIEDFAIGFALTEGIIDRAEQIESLRVADAADGMLCNLTLDPARIARVEGRRRSLAGRAGCGICGAQSIEAVLPTPRRVPAAPLPDRDALLRAFAELPSRQAMKQVNRTTHAAAFCDVSGKIELVREDIGRHNALDKLAGALACEGRDARGGFVLLSSRVSVEMVQKAAAISAPLVAAVSAPSALALRLAGRAGLALACFAGRDIMIFDKPALAAPSTEKPRS